LFFAEIPGLGADGEQGFVVVVAFLAFVDVGNLIGEIVRTEFNGDGIGDELKSGFSLRVVPDVGKSGPSGICMNEQTSFDQSFRIAGREGKGLGENRANWEFKDSVIAILGRSALWHPDEAVFVGVVGEERSAQGIGKDAIVGFEAVASFCVEMPSGKFLGKGFGKKEVNFGGKAAGK